MMTPYYRLLERLLAKAEAPLGIRSDRTNTGTVAEFGTQMVFDLREGFPLLAERELSLADVTTELLWFLRGETGIDYLEKHGCKWWSNQCSVEGDVGPLYPAQWRGHTDLDGKKHPDQFKQLIDTAIIDPTNRRLVVDCWEPNTIPENNCDYDANVKTGKMAIPPCHPLYQIYFEPMGDVKYLHLKFYMRSSDSFLGLPANIASYALLMHIIGNLTDSVPCNLIYSGGDVHLYRNHFEAAKTLIGRRTPASFKEFGPSYRIDADLKELVGTNYDFTNDSIRDILINGLSNYHPKPAIKVRMAR